MLKVWLNPKTGQLEVFTEKGEELSKRVISVDVDQRDYDSFAVLKIEVLAGGFELVNKKPECTQ